MKRRMIALVAALSLATLVFSGCANKDVVKSEDAGTATVADTANQTKQPYFKAEDSTATQQQIAEASGKNSEAEAAAAAKIAKGISPFDTVYFDYDKSDLSQESRNTLNKNAELMLKSRKGDKIKIEGHCDERGSAEYNLALGERRAKSAMQYLITLGVQPDRLSIVSYGKEKPAVQGSTEEAWAKNRRAEFTLDK